MHETDDSHDDPEWKNTSTITSPDFFIYLPVNKKKMRTMIMVYPKYKMVLASPVICSFEKK